MSAKDINGAVQQIREAQYSQAQNEKLGMSWFEFTINFRLFAGLLRYVFDFIFVVNSSADEESLVVTGILCVLFSVINLYVRHSLSCFYRDSLKLYFVAMYAVPIICDVFITLVTEDVSSLSGAMALLIYVIPELIYYHKRAHLFNIIPRKGKFKNMQSANKIKVLIIGAVYVLVVFIQFAAFTPYTKTETYISSQNVPHTVTIDTGYTSINTTNYTYTDKKGITERKRINYTLLTFQLASTTMVALIAYYFWCHKKTVNTLAVDNDTYNSDILKKQNIQLQQTIDKLADQNNKIKLENKALKEQIMSINNSFDEVTAATENLFMQEQVTLADIPAVTEPPYLDINGLAFADDDEIRNAQKQYAEELYKYFKTKEQKGGGENQ